MFATEPTPTFSPPEMQRPSSSNESINHCLPCAHEIPPALISSTSAPSIPSASSSTVGSPYSGPSQLVASHDGYGHDPSYGLGLLPTIVNHEAFPQDLIGTTLDAELAMAGHEKLPDRCVGECADLSSFETGSPTYLVAPVCRQSSSATAAAATATAFSSSFSSPSLSPSSLSSGPLSASAEVLASDPVLGRSAIGPALAQSVIARPSAVKWSSSSDGCHQAPQFKLPKRPASAHSHHLATDSPVGVRSPGSRSAPQPKSHLGPPRPAAAPSSHDHHLMQHHVGLFQSHFFAQSSGSFMPPLESSCSLLLCRRLFLFSLLLFFVFPSQQRK